MSVFRVHKTDNYTTMSNHHLRNNNLTLKAKGLMSVMLSLPEDWDYSAKGLSTLSLGGEDAVKSALKELEEQRYLKRTPIREKGVIRDWQYDIYENPESLENTECQPQGEKPLVVQPLVEKQSQINTKEINTKNNNIDNFTNVKLEQPAVTQQPKRRVRLVDTPNNIQDTDSVNKSAKKKDLYTNCLTEIDKFTDDEEIRDMLKVYLPIRLSRRDITLNLPTFRGMLKRLSRVATTREDKINSIQKSIDKQYPTFYEVRQYNNRKKFAEGDGLKMGISQNEEIADEVF